MRPFRQVGFGGTRLALLASVLLLALSILLMTSATYAWFSDSVVNRGNTIRYESTTPASDEEATPATEDGEASAGLGDELAGDEGGPPAGSDEALGGIGGEDSAGDAIAGGEGEGDSSGDATILPPDASEGGGSGSQVSASNVVESLTAAERDSDLVPKRTEREG